MKHALSLIRNGAAFIMLAAVSLFLFGCQQSTDSSLPSDSGSPGPLRTLTTGDDAGYYASPYSHILDHQRLTYIDYASQQELPLCAVPNCTHTDDSCSAWIAQGSAVPFILDNEHLVMIFTQRDPAQCRIEISNRDGSDRHILLEDPSGFDSIQGFLSTESYNSYLADNQYIYYLHSETNPQAASGQQFLCRVPQSGGTAETLFPLNIPADESCGDPTTGQFVTGGGELKLLGVSNRNLILCEFRFSSAPSPDTEDALSAESFDSTPDTFYRIFSKNVDTGEERTLKEWACKAASGDSVPALIWDNDTLYWCDATVGDTLFWLNATGESGNMTIQWPDSVADQDSWLIPERILDHRLLVRISTDSSIVRYAIDLNSGSCTPLTLSYLSNGREVPVEIVQITSQYVLARIDVDNTMTQVSEQRPDGTVYNQDVILDALGLISYEDFFASRPHYQEIQVLPVA